MKEMIANLKTIKEQLFSFTRGFFIAFFTQLIALGADRMTDYSAYVMSAIIAAANVILAYLNPADKRFGVGKGQKEDPEAPKED